LVVEKLPTHNEWETTVSQRKIGKTSPIPMIDPLVPSNRREGTRDYVQEMHEGGKGREYKKKEELEESSRGVWEKGVG
jgi:hypothetical protein